MVNSVRRAAFVLILAVLAGPAPAQETVNACFTRPQDADADRIGLPKTFCLASIALVAGENRLEIAGSPVSGRRNITGVAWDSQDRPTLSVRLIDAHDRDLPCGRLNAADATIEIGLDAQGALDLATLRVTGLIFEVGVKCPATLEPRAVEYLPERS